MIVILESPLAGDVEANRAYACACLRALLLRGDAPFASHLLYALPGVLDDAHPDERKIGMHAGFVFYSAADLCAVCVDRGISSGMRQGIGRAMRHRVPIRYYRLVQGDQLAQVEAPDGEELP